MPPICPSCNCENTESVSVVFESAVRSCGAGGPGQAALLQQAAPPKKGSYFNIFQCWFVGTMAMDLVSSMCHWPKVLGQSLISAILIASVFALLRAYMFNRNDWPHLFEKWQHSYICLQCSNIFERNIEGKDAASRQLN